jgi:hypothetical protein
MLQGLKNAFLHGTSAAVLSSVVSYAYSSFYFDLLVDFSEGGSMGKLGLFFFWTSGIFTLSFSLFYHMFAISVIKNKTVAELLTGFLFSGITIGLVFYVLKMKDPTFKSEDVAIFVDFYKGFIMPLLFFPLLSWFTLKSLFTKFSTANKTSRH